MTSKIISVRFTPAEKEKIKKLAESLHISISAVVRLLVFNDNIKSLKKEEVL